MADLIELDLVVRDKGLKASISTVERLERQIIKAAKAVDQNSISQVRYNKILLSTKREYEALGLSSQKATSTVRSFADAQRKATAEAAKENSALKKLKSSYDSVYAAEQKRLRLKKLLRAEVAAGTMTLREAGRELLLYRKHLHETSQGFQFAKNRANKFGMVAQQVGYQVGDFFVQVQSGTSALVALGQQGTQLAGLLPGVYGAVVGIGLSIGTMLLKSLYDASGASKTFKERMDDSIEAMDKFKEAVTVATQSTAELINSFGVWGNVVRPLLEDITKLEQLKAFKMLNQQFDNLTVASKSFLDYAREGFNGANQAVQVMAKNLGLTVQQYYEIQKQIAGIRDLETNAERITAAAKIRDTLKATFGTLENMPEKMREFYRQLTLTVLTGAELEASMGKTGDQLDTTVDKVQDLKRSYMELYSANRQAAADQKKADQDAIKAIRDAISLHRKELRDKVAISEVEATYGSKSEWVALKKAQLARDAYEESLKEQNILGNNLKIEMGIYDDNIVSYNINKKITEEKDKQLKVSEKISANLVTMADAEYQMLLTYQAYGESRVAGAKVKPTKGTKGAKPTTMEGPIKALERQIELSKALFGLQGTARREEEIYMQLKFQNQDVDIKAGKEELELLAERVALEEQRTEAEQMNLKNISPLKKYVAEYAKLVKLKDSGLGDEAFAKEVAKLNEELAKSNPLLNSFTDAFADFLGRGARDFKSFAKDILNDFKSMLIQMITTAARNKIMFSMGMGGGALGTAAAAGGGGTGSSIANLGVLGNAVSSFAGSGIASGVSSALGLGGYASQGLFNVAANAQVAAAAGANAMAASIGAAIPPLLAVGAVFSFLRTRTKELDSGLRVTVDNMDVLVKSFKTIQKSRFFGLSKKVRTSEEEASSDISDPIVDAVVTIQESVMEAASAFGVASDKFNDFTYDFEVSLKGLTEDQKMEKLNEEFTKLGDTFTEMSELFTNMNDLMAVYQQRLELEKQLLVAQGDVVKLREQELETIHVLNRDLATRLHLLQAEGDTQSALTAFASGISEQQGIIRRAVDALVKPLQDAIDRTRTQAEKSYSIFKTAADKSADSAKNIVDIITSALDSRTIISESAELMRYQTAQKQLASFAGGSEFDEASLRRATEGVSIDSQKFFGSFEDYARDFYRTQINLEDLAAVAEKELSEVEQQIDIAQKAYEVAMGTHQEAVDLNTAIETLAQDLNIYEATKLANEPLVKMVQDEGNRQIELLDSILVETTKQVNTQLGIESSMADLVGNTVSIGDAMDVLGLESESLAGGVLALEDIERDINGNVTDLGLYVVDFEGAVKKLDTSVFDLTGTVDDLDGDIKTLFDNINLLEGGIDDFGVKVDGLGVSTDNLGIDITSLGETLSSAMSSLGSIVSGLSSAVSGLASSNNNLAAAQQKAASASETVSITNEAAVIAAEISSIESSRGTTRTGPTEDQKKKLAKLNMDLLEEENKDGRDRNYGTGYFFDEIEKLKQEIAAQVVPAELSVEDAVKLVLLSGNLEDLRKEITALGGTPTFATGGYHSGGMRLVGENGPELEATGPSRIYSAQQTRNMLSGGSGEVVVELRSLRREVSELKAEQRKVGVENVKYNKKSYDLYREWDTVGLPATRTA